MKFTKRYFNLTKPLTVFAAIACFFASCGSDCYENEEPKVYLTIHNNCRYEEIIAEGIRNPIIVRNDCDSNQAKTVITLPLLEEKKTYFLTDGYNKIDSFTTTYSLEESFQGACGYVVMLNNFAIDSTASSLPFYYELSSAPYDTINTYVTYSTHADYMRNYY
ncbi:MAG: hypothetical protein JXQ87_15705 [Bacteroidia bacterium]